MGSIIGFFASIFGYVLNFIYGFVKNYGLAIIIFSIVMKIIMLPLSIKQQKTMKKSAKLQVKLKEIQSKYSNDQTRLAQETMDLYKSENMSPFSGCLSSIFQLLILLSIFFLVKQPLTYMLRIDQKTINEYKSKINTQQSQSAYEEIEIIRHSKNHDDINIDLDMNFLGVDLSNVPTSNWKEPTVYIIPGLYVISSFISIKLTTNTSKKKKKDGEKSKSEEEEAMEQLNRNMSIMMPIMSITIAIIAPLGLALYWLVNNILMTGERLILDRVLKDEEEV